jgi:hypothetical protein
MGLDFLRRTAKSSSKAWDRGKADLSIPSLFGQQPERQTRTVLADYDDGVKLSSGEPLTFYLRDQNMLVVRENTRIGEIKNPPPDIVAKIRDAGGCALGQVQTVNQLSGTADVEIK